MPPLRPRRLVPDADAPPAVPEPIEELFQPAMAAVGGSWTDMICDEDNDVDGISLFDLDSTKKKVAKPKRAGNYTHEEDIQLCMSWDNISTDPITANEQPGRAYWKRIAEHYHKHKTFVSDRNANSLEHRWSTIQKDCMLFQGFYEEVECLHPSGAPYQDHILQAQTLYAKPPQKKTFQFLHCWLKIRHCQKFLSIETNKRPWGNSRSSTPSEGAAEEGDGSGWCQTPDSTQPMPKKRPTGRKKAKEMLKTGGDVGPYKEAIEELHLEKKEEKKFRVKRWEEKKNEGR